jgi:hypothetical protein
MADLRELVVAGPNPDTDEVIGWRCVDLHGEIASRFSVTVHERTVGKWLRKLKLTRLKARPYHPKKDPAAEKALALIAFQGGSVVHATRGSTRVPSNAFPRRRALCTNGKKPR